MEAYFNELSSHSFTDNETAKNAFLLLGNCLKKLSEMGVSNTRMTDEATRKGILSGQTLNRVLNNEAVIDKDLKSVIINRMCTLEPIDDLENKYNVTGFQYNGEDCKGLGWACEDIEDSVAVEQIYYRLRDLERVAANSIVPISTSIFKYKTTPESETRSRLPEMFVKFEDGETRHCSWHSRFTPGAGRIHFYYDESEKIFYVGYIGEKL